MRFDTLTDVAGGIVLVALVTTLVVNPGTAKVVTAGGNAFAGSIRAALGKK